MRHVRSRALRVVVGLLALLTVGLAAVPSVSAQVLGRPQDGSFGPDGTSATIFSGGLVSQLAFNQANDKLYAIAKGATNGVAASIHSFNAPAHTTSGGAFPMAVAAPGAEPDIAVDNTAGASANNIYYSSESTHQVYGFASAGTGLAGWPVAFTLAGRDICGVNVDSTGNVWITNFGGATGNPLINRGVHKYDSAGVFQSKLDTAAQGGPCHVSFDSNDDMYVNIFNGPSVGVWKYTAADGYTTRTRIDPVVTRAVTVDRIRHRVYVVHAAKVSVYDSAGALLYEFADSIPGASFRGIAIDEGTDTVYLSDAGTNATTAPGNNKIWIFGATQAKTDASAAPTAATAVTSSEATLNATVTDNNFFPTSWRIEYSRDGVSWSAVASGTTAGSQTNAVISATVGDLLPNTLYRYRVITNKGAGSSDVVSAEATFLTDTVAPTIVSSGTDSVTTTSARLIGFVNPNSTPTTYRFEWGTTAGSYPNRIPMPNAPLGSGPTPAFAAQEVDGLTPGTTYHFRLVAESASAGTAIGPARTFATRVGPVPARVPELVSLPDKGAHGWVGAYIQGASIRPAADGESAYYGIAGGAPDSTASGEVRYMAARGADGWTSGQMTPGQLMTANPGEAGSPPAFVRFLPRDLSCSIIESQQSATDDPEVALMREGGGASLFRRDASGEFELLMREIPTNLRTHGASNDYAIAGASQDCRRVIFRTPFRYAGLNSSGLYEVEDGQLHDVAVMPDGSPATGIVRVGSAEQVTGVDWRAVSADASRVYFTATSNGGNPPGTGNDTGKAALYLREGGQTVKVSGSKTAIVNQGAAYQTASLDGSKVLFMANYGLAPASSNGPVASNCEMDPPQPCALYLYDVDAGELTDISATDAPANTAGARVAGVVAASDDLSRVYFTAQAQLVPGRGRTYAQNFANGTYNVYLWDNSSGSATTRFVATVVQSDLLSNQTGLLLRTVSSLRWRSRSTPSGMNLLFVSRANIVGYDSGGVAQVYLYSAAAGETTCLSCRRDGEESTGNAETTPITGQLGQFYSGYTDPTGGGKGTVNQTVVSVTDDGEHAFFKSPDALAPGGVNGQANIYEWNQGVTQLVVSGPLSRTDATNLEPEPIFFGSSSDGEDVFVRTSQSFDPRDTDGVHDLYDFRIGGRAPTAVEPSTPCAVLADGCQGSGTGSVATPIDSEGPGGGDLTPQARKLLLLRMPSLSQRRLAARSGSIAIAVRTTAAGEVTAIAKGRIGTQVRRVAAKSVRAPAAGLLSIRLSLNRAARKRLRNGHRLDLAVRVSAPGARARTMTLRLPGAGS